MLRIVRPSAGGVVDLPVCATDSAHPSDVARTARDGAASAAAADGTCRHTTASLAEAIGMPEAFVAALMADEAQRGHVVLADGRWALSVGTDRSHGRALRHLTDLSTKEET